MRPSGPVARKTTTCPTLVRSDGVLLPGPGWTSASGLVLAAAPAETHGSLPAAVDAENTTLSFSAVSWVGELPAAPGWMSATSTVPAAVPSVFHSSAPVEPLSAEK